MGRLVIGVDLGASNCRIAIVGDHAQVIAHEEMDSIGGAGAEAGLERLAEVIRRMIGDADCGPIAGVGIGCPGPIDAARTTVLEAPNMPGWRDVPLKAILEERLSLPVYIENDANIAVYGEYHLGAGRGCSSLLGLTLGTGIGGGFVTDGELFTGAHGAALEVGHVHVGGEGLKCGCGAVDCLESYVSGEGIKAWYARRSGNAISCLKIFDLARAGDVLAGAVIADAARLLGKAIAALQKLLDPERIIVSGGLSREWDLLVAPAEKEAKLNLFQTTFADFDLKRAELGTDAGLFGAAELVRKQVPSR